MDAGQKHSGMTKRLAITYIIWLFWQIYFDALGNLPYLRHDLSFIDREQTTVFHNEPPVDHDRIHIGATGGINQVRIFIVNRRQMRLVQRDNYEVGFFTGRERPYLLVQT
jgi:hypothetical protein